MPGTRKTEWREERERGREEKKGGERIEEKED